MTSPIIPTFVPGADEVIIVFTALVIDPVVGPEFPTPLSASPVVGLTWAPDTATYM